jgi:hypothetical protein
MCSAAEVSLAKTGMDGLKKSGVVSYAPLLRRQLQPRVLDLTISVMKIFVSLLVTVGFLWGIYILYLKRIPTVGEGTVATQAANLTGVKMDLLQIAKAERTSIGVDGHCMTMDELLASGSMSMSRPERDGYSYSVACSGNDFTATARHAPAPAGSAIRYPNMMIDQSMQVREVE